MKIKFKALNREIDINEEFEKLGFTVEERERDSETWTITIKENLKPIDKTRIKEMIENKRDGVEFINDG